SRPTAAHRRGALRGRPLRASRHPLPAPSPAARADGGPPGAGRALRGPLPARARGGRTVAHYAHARGPARPGAPSLAGERARAAERPLPVPPPEAWRQRDPAVRPPPPHPATGARGGRG